MKKIIAAAAITVSLAACGNNGSNNVANDDTRSKPTTITSGNTDARQGQVIPTDSVETSKDSTGDIRPGDTTKK